MTLTETGTHSAVDARVGGFRGGEPELAVAMAGRAAGMLVIMDRGFPGVALWKAYTQAGVAAVQLFTFALEFRAGR